MNTLFGMHLGLFLYNIKPGKTVESAVPWKMKTLSPRRFAVGSIALVAACAFAWEMRILTLIVFGKDIHMVAAIRPPDAQLYGTRNDFFFLHTFLTIRKLKTNVQQSFQHRILPENEQSGIE